MSDKKTQLRSALRKEYAILSDDERNVVDVRLIERLMGHDLYVNCETLFLYASVGTEINTHPLIRGAYRSGKTVALPKCVSLGIMNYYRYTGTLAQGKYRIPEPVSEEIVVPREHDLMIVPGLAFDSNGYRIGQGGGYYDRYLSRHSCIRVGLCRERFLLKDIPIQWNDIPVDYVITEKAVYDCKKNGASEEAPSP